MRELCSKESPGNLYLEKKGSVENHSTIQHKSSRIHTDHFRSEFCDRRLSSEEPFSYFEGEIVTIRKKNLPKGK